MSFNIQILLSYEQICIYRSMAVHGCATLAKRRNHGEATWALEVGCSCVLCREQQAAAGMPATFYYLIL